VERFTGPWNHTLATPILVIGNRADPITPYVHAKRVADLLGDSAILIEQDDFGHTSLVLMSKCTVTAMHAYWVQGTVSFTIFLLTAPFITV
jgi:predicted esterase